MAKLHTVKKNGEYYGEPFDTGWVDITLVNGVTARENNMLYTPQVRRIGKIVYLKGQVSIPVSSVSRDIAIIPEGFKASYEVGFPKMSTNTWMNAAGRIVMVQNSTALSNQQLFTSWLVE